MCASANTSEAHVAVYCILAKLKHFPQSLTKFWYITIIQDGEIWTFITCLTMFNKLNHWFKSDIFRNSNPYQFSDYIKSNWGSFLKLVKN